MQHALVTGGAGFIGIHLVRRLLDKGFRVTVLDNLCWGHRERLPQTDRVRVIEADVRSLPEHERELLDVTHVFHLAAQISGFDSQTEPDFYLSVNVLGTLRVLELCAKLSRPRLVFASTSGVYGNTSAAIKSETDVPAPITVYATSKLTCEHLLAGYRDRHGFEDVSLRFFNVYGPGQNPIHPYANVTCKFARAAAVGEAVKLYGDGEQARDFVYVDDTVDALLAVATRPIKQRVYNVGSETRNSVRTLLDLVKQNARREFAIQAEPPWPNDIRAIQSDCSALRADHGWTAKVSLEEGLKRTIDYFATNNAPELG